MRLERLGQRLEARQRGPGVDPGIIEPGDGKRDAGGVGIAILQQLEQCSQRVRIAVLVSQPSNPSTASIRSLRVKGLRREWLAPISSAVSR